jgi:peptidoglycan-associated lipoprotein
MNAQNRMRRIVPPLVAGMTALALAGCHSYVKRDEFDATVAQLRGDISATQTESRNQIAALSQDLQNKLQGQQVAITDLQDRLLLDMTAHFGFDKAELRPTDQQALADFASVMSKRPTMEVTVQGFADSAGSPAYNKKLGQRRADVVRDYLVAQGLSTTQVKTMSYGEQASHQVVPGAWGVQGQANRRVAFVIEPTANQTGALEQSSGPNPAGKAR